MTIHEFGDENKEAIILIHPSLVKWDYFEYVIPHLKDDYHLIIPALPGYDFDEDGDFTGVEEIAREINDWIKRSGVACVHAVYGCSMGGSVSLLVTLGQSAPIRHCVMDGGITPYRLPRIVTRFIALKDYLMIMTGKAGGVKLLEKAFATDEYSDEDLEYVAEVLNHCSGRTIWRTFDSCNNYRIPSPLPNMATEIHYWYAGAEEKARKNDIAFMRDTFPQTRFRLFKELGHGGLALKTPELFSDMIRSLGGTGNDR
ncbi:MAG: alpha/beta hydrolase [Clostridia bacterium]|nr:alpha/beta hydrolase [Clostridia bacterium]